ncbi:MAG: DUF1501 domain-containing protein [Steroidobacteraceae bacterium]
MNRRTLLGYAAATGAAAILPKLVLADAAIDARFVLVILRGALDGLAAVPALGDPNYAKQRGVLQITERRHLLDGTFALHPSLTHSYELYRRQELIVFHAVATPYRERSHFDGQDLLELGTTTAAGQRDGWLNRLLPVLPGARTHSTEQLALALAQNIPLVLRGEARVSSWAPSRLPAADSDTLQRIADLYAHDAVLSQRLEAALTNGKVAMNDAVKGPRDPLSQLTTLSTAAGKLLADAKGARIAVIEVGGWDTHANQGADIGPLANRLRALDEALAAFQTSLGTAWQQTAVLVVTEFGRTVAVNGTRGTDHGTATCALLAGGAVAGGKVIARWPGLAPRELYQARDLQPTLDLRAVFKGLALTHLGASEGDVEQRVFADSRGIRPIEGLIRRA